MIYKIITIINGTNRPGNITQIISKKYAQILESKGVNVNYFSLENLPDAFGLKNIYDSGSPLLKPIIQEFLQPVEKLVIVSPEYNGSFPGVLKVFLDAIHPQQFRGKKVALVGVSDGRAGNLRGLDTLTNNFHYLGVHVLPMKVPVSQVMHLIKDEELMDVQTIKTLERQADAFMGF